MKSGKTITELAMEIERRRELKRDYLVPTQKLAMSPDLQISAGDLTVGVNDLAHGQIAAHTGIPKAYYDRMKQEAPALLADNVNQWFAAKPETRMLRTLDGKARAFLSDRYRALENEDLAEAALPAIADLGLDIMSCEITDRRLYIKAVDPRVTRELSKHNAKFGDGGHTIVRVLSPAITISNSEVGLGMLSILGGTYDGFCSNLATFGERSLKKYHVGAKHELGDDVYSLLSDNTRRISDAALWAQVGDIFKIAFDRAKFDALVNKIEGAAEDKIDDAVRVVDLSAKRFALNDTEKTSVLKRLIEGADLSRMGLHNAITRASQDVADYDRATELERVGGQVIELKRNEWAELAAAA